MNNLKKVLALGLALVMLFGMFTIASAAKEEKMVASDLTDWNTVAHKDAVTLMVDLGIINGMPDGSFQPNGNIDRASWAKMVYFAATGSDDADAYLGTNTALKDISGNWAESYISYLASMKYVSGDNYGNYNPSNNVTVAEACKMMLTVLGYDAEDRGYQNDAAWSGNIMRDAKRFGLMTDVDSAQTALVPLTRENAAQIVYNALQANTVLPSVQWDGGVKHVTSYDKDSTLGFDVFSVVGVEVVIGSINEDGTANIKEIVSPSGLMVGNLTKKVKASADMVGEHAIIFAQVSNIAINEKTGEVLSATWAADSKVISSSVAKTASVADATFTGGFYMAHVFDDTSRADYVAPLPADESQVNFYVNGDATAFSRTALQKYVQDQNGEKLPGAVVEIYVGDDGNVATIKVYAHSVGELTADAETRTNSGVLQVRVPGVVGSWTDADKVTGYQGLVEGDVVLFYKNDAGAIMMEKAEKVTGTATAGSKNFRVGGTSYTVSALKNMVNAANNKANMTPGMTWTDNLNEYDFFMDKNGSLIYYRAVTDKVAQGNIALVLAAEWSATNLDTAAGNLRAKLLFADGTTQVVTISKLDTKKVVTEFSSTNAAKNEIIGGPKTDKDSETSDMAISILNGNIKSAFYNYRVVDGKYELTECVDKGSAAVNNDWLATEVIEGATIEKVSKFAGSSFAYSANNNTVFIVEKGDSADKQYFTYTGFKNVPEMKEANGIAIADNENKGVARYVFLTTEKYQDDVPDGLVFIYNNDWEPDDDNEGMFLINVIDTKGKQAQLSVTEDIKDAVAADKMDASAWTTNNYVGKFWAIDDVDEKGVVSSFVEDGSVIGEGETVTAMGAGVVTTTGTSMDYDNITQFYFVDVKVDDNLSTTVATDDKMTLGDFGEFDPENFFNADDVDPEGTEKVPGSALIKDAEKSCHTVKAVMISQDDITADYVYVVRVVW